MRDSRRVAAYIVMHLPYSRCRVAHLECTRRARARCCRLWSGRTRCSDCRSCGFPTLPLASVIRMLKPLAQPPIDSRSWWREAKPLYMECNVHPIARSL
ncbi:hypothetical protein K437DRAFT_12044 [Tilletiaria anomala UBC 951]|uniref:Uncharacterized protein n=1 Tax=Tilletiaria anomala (strain ATCC 24038 / CBS 436.72 / UBC 951) TaxID=1037660 RepID=A0A066VLH5_TILAU|nr:uncharacterized protein K437DRAFT_12044 [Tilletiaria anomala UBC 951]KDN39405.1 hypothetical protein K437DRAFT_12044 [Tilletiaria anomala UBC 951]